MWSAGSCQRLVDVEQMLALKSIGREANRYPKNEQMLEQLVVLLLKQTPSKCLKRPKQLLQLC